jgi:hypothetical protein
MRTLIVHFEIDDEITMSNDDIMAAASQLELNIKKPEVPPTGIPPKKIVIDEN